MLAPHGAVPPQLSSIGGLGRWAVRCANSPLRPCQISIDKCPMSNLDNINPRANHRIVIRSHTSATSQLGQSRRFFHVRFVAALRQAGDMPWQCEQAANCQWLWSLHSLQCSLLSERGGFEGWRAGSVSFTPMLQEEAHHLACRFRPVRVGI
jgi:hypothetical protein